MEKPPDTVIHPTATVHPQAQLDVGVWVGPGSIIGPHVSIGKNTRLESHVSVEGHTEIGEDCRFFPFSSIGTDPQDVAYAQEETRLSIGGRNIFREFMTVNRGSTKDEGLTRIGSDNYFMAYSHIAHDCRVGEHNVFINGVTLGGHCWVDDYTQVGAFTGFHPFCKVGKYAFIGGYSVITQDVLPFCKVAGGRPPLIYGPNAIGLRRLGFSRDRIKSIKAMFKLIFLSDLNTSQAVERITQEFSPSPDREEVLSFIQASTRGILKKLSDEWKKDSV
jgi:UDP-N-acetylglucosamine acyltransferase